MTEKNLDYGYQLRNQIQSIQENINGIDSSIRLKNNDHWFGSNIIKGIESELKVMAIDLLNKELQKLQNEFDNL